MAKNDYDYETAGFDPFLSRSIDQVGATLADSENMNYSRQMNFDQQQVSGSLGDVLRVGNIQLDGVQGRISVYDGDNNEVVRIGSL